MKQTKIDYGHSMAAPDEGGEYEPFVAGPNPELAGFIDKHSKSYEAARDDYQVPAFQKDLLVHKHNKLYTLHLYWSKKDPVAISNYIQHYTHAGDVVLDPFCGAGTTGCAALSLGRKPILIDVSASAGYLSYHYCIAPEPSAVDDVYRHLLEDGRGEAVDRLFTTRCHRCKGPALVEFIVWSDCYQCRGCTQLVPLFDCLER